TQIIEKRCERVQREPGASLREGRPPITRYDSSWANCVAIHRDFFQQARIVIQGDADFIGEEWQTCPIGSGAAYEWGTREIRILASESAILHDSLCVIDRHADGEIVHDLRMHRLLIELQLHRSSRRGD